MERFKMTLTKVERYDLVAFGRFIIKWNCSEALAKKPHILPYANVRFNDATGMPYTGEQEKEFCKYMKKYKTDVLTDGRDFYTRMGDNWLTISHPKLYNYKEFLRIQNLDDCLETWEKYINMN